MRAPPPGRSATANRRPPPHRRTGIRLDGLINRARQAHQAVEADPAAALWSAFEAGDALIASKDQVPRGEWGKLLGEARIPPSSARLYMQLARAKDYIVASGATSIRQARQLVSDTRPKRKARVWGRVRPRAAGQTIEQDVVRYQEGYVAGYRAGRADGWSEAADEKRAKESANSAPPPRSEDMRWLITLAHPDRHMADDRVVLKATRCTQWLNDLRANPNRG